MFRIENLSLAYPTQNRKLIDGISVTLQQGELLYLKGANGSGKTSILNAISGIIPQRVKAEVSGSITFNGTDLSPIQLNERFRYLCYQMSDPETQIFFPRLEKEIAFALENQGLHAQEIRRRIDSSADFFGISPLLSREPSTLSFGQKKLLLFATCSAMQTPLILLDEPSAGLSVTALDRLLAWLRNALKEGRIVVMAEHNQALTDLASQVLDLDTRV